MKLLTITICCYNSARTILRALKSLDIHSDEIDVFIIDDGSTDNLKDVVSSYVDDQPNIFHYFRKENGNWGDCVNFAISKANSHFISILDSDDTYNIESLSKILDVLRINNTVDLVVCNYSWIFKNNRKKINVSKTKKMFEICSIKKLSLYHVITIHSLIFNLSILKNIKPLPVKAYYTDTYLTAQALLNTNNICCVNRNIVLYNYFVNQNCQSISLNNTIKNFSDLESVFNKLLELKSLDISNKRKQHLLKIFISRQLYWLVLVLSNWNLYSRKEKIKKIKSYCSKMVEFDKMCSTQITCFTFLAKFINTAPSFALFISKIGSIFSKVPFMKAIKSKK